jgi:hypothetical protein
VLDAKQKSFQNDTVQMEQEIDQLVFQLYDLTPLEKEIIENS